MLASFRSSLSSLVVAGGIAVAVAGPVVAQQPVQTPGPTTPSITASARAETTVTPDRATASIGVETRASTAGAAAAENAARLARIIDAVRAAGIAAAQIRTVRYDVSPVYVYDRGEESRRLTGYRVSNVVEVEVPQVDRVGQILDAALRAGANTIHSIQFSTSSADAARRAAAARAVEKARLEAETLARAAGGTLGGLLELTSVGYEPPGPPRPFVMERAAVAASVPTPIEPGQHTVSARVTARWRFVPRGG